MFQEFNFLYLILDVFEHLDFHWMHVLLVQFLLYGHADTDAQVVDEGEDGRVVGVCVISAGKVVVNTHVW